MLFRLRSGRLLEFASYGVPLVSRTANRDCVNILYHHGWPSCRHEGAFLHPHAQALGLRVLAVNRPGVGRTSPTAVYSFQSVVDDVRQLLDGLGLDRVVFMGTSGGGPYACACACLLPERTSAVCLMASMTHTRNVPELLQGMALSNRLGFLALNHTPWLARGALGAGSALLRLGAALGMGPMAAAREQAAPGDEPLLVDGAAVDLSSEGTGAGAGAAHGTAARRGDKSARRSVAAAAAPPEDPRVAAAAEAAAGSSAPLEAVVAKAAEEAEAAIAGSSGGHGDGGGGGGGGGAVRRAAAGEGLSAAVTAVMLAAAGFSREDRGAVARQLRDRPELAALMSRSGSEAAAQGFDGLYEDMRLTSEPWGLPLERITAPTFIWQGDRDHNVTVAMARHLHRVIPGARGRLRIVSGAGHISLGLDHGREVLQALTGGLQG